MEHYGDCSIMASIADCGSADGGSIPLSYPTGR